MRGGSAVRFVRGGGLADRASLPGCKATMPFPALQPEQDAE